MAEYLIQDTTLTDLGNAVRILTGSEETMTPAEMITALNTINIGGGSEVVVGGITTATASPSITIPYAVGKANIALMYMSSGSYQASAMADAGIGSVIVHGDSHSYTIMYASELHSDSNDGFIKYDSTTGTISLSSNRYNETFIAGNYMYVTWGSVSGGNTPSTLITFYIDGTEYQAEEGMTWTEWVEKSEYNTDGYSVYEDGRIYTPDFNGYIMRPDDNMANDSDVITSDASYYICPTDGEEL